MAKTKVPVMGDFSFNEFLWQYYSENRGKIRSRYNDLTKKYLDYNDKTKRNDAFLRKPQFEALEMYVFIKEFLDNAQVYKVFDDWHKRKGDFSDRSYYALDKYGQRTFFDAAAYDYKAVFEYMRKNAAVYSNYIYALTMGLGKTVLMATCIFYEFLLMNKYPKDSRFCHNALVFAPDKTVLESLREIVTFDISKVVPREYCHILNSNIKFHFLLESGTTLDTLDGSDFNIIISNTQKIIKKRVHREKTAHETLFKTTFGCHDTKTAEDKKGDLDDFVDSIYNDEAIRDEIELTSNQRFERLSRLNSLGIYVDEAHHMFGKDLQKSMSSLRLTINELAAELKEKGTSVVACYNYTGTPYTENSVLPEVVYSYGLSEAIKNNYLKEVDIFGYENVKSATFIKTVIKDFWGRYNGKTYEGLQPKLAIFGATIEEVTTEIHPIVDEALSELGIPLNKVLVNVGDDTITKGEDIRHFNDLDIEGTVGSEKQFILLCNKGREGWNCRSLFGVALFRSPKSTIFVLQATMRCLRQITDDQQEAIVRLSKENLDILNAELKKNYRINIENITTKSKKNKELFTVHLKKDVSLLLNEIKHTYELIPKDTAKLPVIDFDLSNETLIEKYKSYVHKKDGLTDEKEHQKTELDTQEENRPYSDYTLTAEIAWYFPPQKNKDGTFTPQLSCTKISELLNTSKDGITKILETVSKYNQIINDVIIPGIFNALYELKRKTETVERKVNLLRLPEGKTHYEFMAVPELVVSYNQSEFKNKDKQNRVLQGKSFHTDYYCFDSASERDFFWQYIKSDKIKEVYFTGMFTSKYNGLAIQYIDPDTHSLRSYYPDFVSFRDDNTIEILEVKGEHLIEQPVTRAKEDAAVLMAAESRMTYRMIPSNMVSNSDIVNPGSEKKIFQYPITPDGYGMGKAAERGDG